MKKHFSGPQIVAKLRQADVLIGQGSTSEEKIEGVKKDLKRNPPKFIITGIDNVKTVNSSKIIDWVYENYTKLSVSEGNAILLVRKSPILNSQDK